MRFIATAATDIGVIKKVNQDSLTLKISHSPWGMVCMAVMCDGLGGLAQGEVASGNVVLAFDKWFKEEFLRSDVEWKETQIKSAWEEIIFTMNKKIREYGAREGVELGTTLSAVIFIRKKYYVIHIGDCRLYEITYKCKQITKDQTLIEQEIERGTITVEEAINDKRRNVLLQCIGVTENLIPSFISREIVPNTSYLLCTDGFRHVISEEEIFQLCRPKSNVLQDVMRHNLCQLIELNKERGERDNISAIWIQVGSI